MLYVASFPGGWFKLGHTTAEFWQRAAHFWTNTHPTDLCGKLGPENVELLALFVGGYAEEQQLFAEFPPKCGDFYHESERSLQSLLEAARLKFEALPMPQKPQWGESESPAEKMPCCGGVEYSCFTCGAKFNRGIKLKQHLDDVHRKVRAKCGGCGIEVIQRNLKRHQQACKK